MITRLLAILFVGLFIIFVYIKFIERKTIFYPEKIIVTDPSSLHLVFEDIYIDVEANVKIHGWFIPYPGAFYTFLFCHGNAGNISHRMYKLYMLRELGFNVCIFDYRGYGKSKGMPSEQGIYKDTEAVYDYLISQKHIRSDQIVLYGESLGTAAAIDLASKRKIGGLIVEGAFSCGKDVGKAWYPFLPRFVFSDTFNSLKKIKSVDAPKLFIHARDDEIISIAFARKLFNVAPPPKEFVEIKGMHNDAYLDSQEEYISSISKFMKSGIKN